MNAPMRLSVLGLVLVVFAAPTVAATPRLRLGTPRHANGMIAVPVILVAKRSDAIAALNFTMRYDPARLAVAAQKPVAGVTVRRARAGLASAAEDTTGRVVVLVVPELSPTFPALRHGRVATIYFRPREVLKGSLRRWVRDSVSLDNVVFGDRGGRELRPASATE